MAEQDSKTETRQEKLAAISQRFAEELVDIESEDPEMVDVMGGFLESVYTARQLTRKDQRSVWRPLNREALKSVLRAVPLLFRTTNIDPKVSPRYRTEQFRSDAKLLVSRTRDLVEGWYASARLDRITRP